MKAVFSFRYRKQRKFEKARPNEEKPNNCKQAFYLSSVLDANISRLIVVSNSCFIELCNCWHIGLNRVQYASKYSACTHGDVFYAKTRFLARIQKRARNPQAEAKTSSCRLGRAGMMNRRRNLQAVRI